MGKRMSHGDLPARGAKRKRDDEKTRSMAWMPRRQFNLNLMMAAQAKEPRKSLSPRQARSVTLWQNIFQSKCFIGGWPQWEKLNVGSLCLYLFNIERHQRSFVPRLIAS
jgi:hypothetical protein